MTAFIILATLFFIAAGDAAVFLAGKKEYLLPLTGGGFLGIVNFLFLQRIIMNLPAGGSVKRFSASNVVLFFISGILFIVLAWTTGQALAVLLGFSTFVLALMVYAVREAFHA